MKIKRGRLQQIIQEELKRVLNEKDSSSIDYLEDVISDRNVEIAMGGRGPGLVVDGETLDMSDTKLYDGLEQLFDDLGPEGVYNWFKVMAYSIMIDKQTADDLGLLDHPDLTSQGLKSSRKNRKGSIFRDNDMDTDNDGKVSVGEFEKELQDIRDDLVDLDDLPWGRVPDPEISGVIDVANAAGAESWQSLKNKELSGAIDDENTVDLDDLDALAKAFKVSKTINHETEDASGTIEIGTINGEPIATWNVMGYTMWMR